MEPFIGQIIMFGGTFAPPGWVLCDGQLLPISGRGSALFSILGTTYGGDGRTTFAVPDLRSRVPLHEGNGFSLGQRGGAPTHTLTTNQLPSHTHTVGAVDTIGSSDAAPNTYLAAHDVGAGYATGHTPDASLNSDSITNSGGGQDHNNIQPYTTINFIIATQGVFPSR